MQPPTTLGSATAGHGIDERTARQVGSDIATFYLTAGHAALARSSYPGVRRQTHFVSMRVLLVLLERGETCGSQRTRPPVEPRHNVMAAACLAAARLPNPPTGYTSQSVRRDNTVQDAAITLWLPGLPGPLVWVLPNEAVGADVACSERR
jgi:hypothetical protein